MSANDEVARTAPREATDTAPLTYTGTAQLLHWLLALLLIALAGTGLYMADLPSGAARSQLIGLHKSLGLSAGALILFRLAWRLCHPPPPLLQLPAWQQRAAYATHLLLYGLMLALPVTGYLRSAFSPYPVKWFGIVLPGWVTPDRGLNQLFGAVHDASAWALMMLVSLHVLAVIWHWRKGQREIALRMWPPRQG